MKSLALLLSRVCLAAWVGASIFFVFVLLDLRQSTLFDDQTKNDHPKILFPLYYKCELGMMGAALVAAAVAGSHPAVHRKAHRVQLALMCVALAIAVADYFFVYGPLTEMLSMNARDATFRTYHLLSVWLNMANLAFWTAAALIALWPAPPSRSDAGLSTS